MNDTGSRGLNTAGVVIPTTRGPVSVVSLEEQDGEEGLSSVGLNKKAGPPVPISSAYQAFVRRSTGIIHQLFAPSRSPFYRLDVSAPVDNGDSWQLAVLITHALHAEGRLDVDAGAGSALVWATGTVSAVGFAVGAVGHVSQKLEGSKELFAAALSQGRKIEIFIPAENQADIEPDIDRWLADHGLKPRFVALADDVFEVFELPAIARAASRPAPAKPSWKGNPYRGLEAYGAEHRPVFFGRSRAREEALEQLRIAVGHGRPFLLIHGQSGVGKSSLVQAGLTGDVAERAYEGGRFRSAVITPSQGGNNPLGALCLGLRSILQEQALQSDVPDTVDEVLRLLARFVAEACVGAERQRGLLVIDQLEELFDPAIPGELATTFGEALSRIVGSEMVWVIATLRSDALGGLDRVPAISRLASQERVYRLVPPSRFELSEIIAAPAALAGKSFPDRAIPETFADIAASSPDSLPLLQAVLYRFFEQANEKGELTADGLKRIGGFEGAVGRWADQVKNQILASGILASRFDRVLATLVRIDPETRRALARPVSYDPRTPEGEILKPLVTARLVSTFDSAKGPQARIAHEALLTHWEHLRQLSERLGTALILRDELEDKARKWTAGTGELISSPANLETAQSFVSDKLVDFDNTVSEYIQHSVTTRQQEERKSARRQKLALAAAIVFAIIASLAVWQWNEARDATQKESAALARETEARKEATLRAEEARRNAEEARRNAEEASRNAQTAKDRARELTIQSALLTPASVKQKLELGRTKEALDLSETAVRVFSDSTVPASIVASSYEAMNALASRTEVSVGQSIIPVERSKKTEQLFVGRSTNSIFAVRKAGVVEIIVKGTSTHQSVLKAALLTGGNEIVVIHSDFSVSKVNMNGEKVEFSVPRAHFAARPKIVGITPNGFVALEFLGADETQLGELIIIDTQTGKSARQNANVDKIVEVDHRVFAFSEYIRDTETPYPNKRDRDNPVFEIAQIAGGVSIKRVELTEAEFNRVRINSCTKGEFSPNKKVENAILEVFDYLGGPSLTRDATCKQSGKFTLVSYLNFDSSGLFSAMRVLDEEGTLLEPPSDMKLSISNSDLSAIHLQPDTEDQDVDYMVVAASNNGRVYVSSFPVYEPQFHHISATYQLADDVSWISFIRGGVLLAVEESTGKLNFISRPAVPGHYRPGFVKNVKADAILSPLNAGTCVGYAGNVDHSGVTPRGEIIHYHVSTMTSGEKNRTLLVLSNDQGMQLKLPGDDFSPCVQFTPDFHYMLLRGDEDIKVFDMIGTIDHGDWSNSMVGKISGQYSSAFFGQDRSIVTTDWTRKVQRWDQTQSGSYSSTLIYRSEYPLRYAEPGPNGLMLIIEDKGDSYMQSSVISIPDQLKIFNLSENYKWLSIGFGKDGLIYFGESYWESATPYPDSSLLGKELRVLSQRKFKTIHE